MIQHILIASGQYSKYFLIKSTFTFNQAGFRLSLLSGNFGVRNPTAFRITPGSETLRMAY